MDVVINASVALQSGARDTLTVIHETAIENMIAVASAVPSPPRFIQISAAGVAFDAATDFFASKARDDAALMASSLDWVVLRPTLVLGARVADHGLISGPVCGLAAGVGLGALIIDALWFCRHFLVFSNPDSEATSISCARYFIQNINIVDALSSPLRDLVRLRFPLF